MSVSIEQTGPLGPLPDQGVVIRCPNRSGDLEHVAELNVVYDAQQNDPDRGSAFLVWSRRDKNGVRIEIGRVDIHDLLNVRIPEPVLQHILEGILQRFAGRVVQRVLRNLLRQG